MQMIADIDEMVNRNGASVGTGLLKVKAPFREFLGF